MELACDYPLSYTVTAYENIRMARIAKIPVVVETKDKSGRVIEKRETKKQLRLKFSGDSAALDAARQANEWIADGFKVDVRDNGQRAIDQTEMTAFLMAFAELLD